VITLTILSTPNRSGYVGLIAVVLLILARGRRFRDIVGLVLVGSVLYWGFLTFGDTSALDYELRGPEDKQSDASARIRYIEASFDVAFEYPMTGVGAQHVGEHVGERVPWKIKRTGELDPHNLMGQVAASGGFPLLAAFIAWLVAMWRRPGEYRTLAPVSSDERLARGLLHIMVLLFLIRGMFSGAVLTTPAFPAALGIALGFCVATRPRVTDHGPAPEDGAAPDDRTRRARVSDALEWSRQTHPRRLVQHDPWAGVR
jgi:O-antigen ligase